VSERSLIKAFLHSQLFDKIRETDSDALQKLIGIEGDVTVLGLALTPQHHELLADVSVIFHSAANVRFDDILKSAIILNARGTHEVIKFALTLKRLEAFLHVSTTYCYPDQLQLDEKVSQDKLSCFLIAIGHCSLVASQTYPMQYDWRQAIRIAELVDVETLEALMPHLTDFSPNSYTYTKGVAEQICESYKQQLPITIVRPSIVTGSEKEPIKGWCDNFNGPVGLLTACGIGIMRTMYASDEAELDCVAVDVVAKTLIVAAWKRAMDNPKSSSSNMNNIESNTELNDRQLSVYNCASLHNMTLHMLVYDGQYLVRNYPFERFLWVPGGGVTLCRFMNMFRVSWQLQFPAFFSSAECHSQVIN